MERVLCVNSQAADFGAVHLQRSGDISSLLAISIQAEGHQVGGSKLDRVPFEDDRRLSGIATPEDGRRGLGGAKGVEDAIL